MEEEEREEEDVEVGIPFRTGILTWGFQVHKKYLNLD
jgi:hypothetical protein